MTPNEFRELLDGVSALLTRKLTKGEPYNRAVMDKGIDSLIAAAPEYRHEIRIFADWMWQIDLDRRYDVIRLWEASREPCDCP